MWPDVHLKVQIACAAVPGGGLSLTGQADVANSLDGVSDEGDETHRTEEFDWFMQIVGKSESRPVEQRRAVVKFRLERRGKKWKIVAIDPLHFFAPPKAS